MYEKAAIHAPAVLPQSLLGIKYAGTQYETDSRYATLNVSGRLENGFYVVEPAAARNFAQRNYLLPLPLQELAINKNLEQNTDW